MASQTLSKPPHGRVLMPVDPREALGRRVKELRGLHGITQEELADRSGLFRTYMSRIESGRANPTLTMLHQIAAAFGVDVRELLIPSHGPVPDRVLSARPVSRGRVRP
jgi:transcriptional regulator with XRE-family HTH domain